MKPLWVSLAAAGALVFLIGPAQAATGQCYNRDGQPVGSPSDTDNPPYGYIRSVQREGGFCRRIAAQSPGPNRDGYGRDRRVSHRRCEAWRHEARAGNRTARRLYRENCEGRDGPAYGATWHCYDRNGRPVGGPYNPRNPPVGYIRSVEREGGRCGRMVEGSPRGFREGGRHGGHVQPHCNDVGGYEEYMRRTGQVCRLD